MGKKKKKKKEKLLTCTIKFPNKDKFGSYLEVDGIFFPFFKKKKKTH
jgi:hypothetical protein